MFHQLPTDLAAWASDLTAGKSEIDAAAVSEAQRLFRVSNCRCLGDYLKTYLRLDVDILYRATQNWRRTIADEVSVDFVQTGKFTISSISNYAGDVNSSGLLQVGQFFPNSAPIYRLLRKDMRG